MSRNLSLALAAAFCLCAAPVAAQTTLDFELGIPGYTTPIPGNYGGFQWSGNPGDAGWFGLITSPPVVATLDPSPCANSGGNTCAFNDTPLPGSGTQVSFSRGTPFNFLSMLMGSWANYSSPTSTGPDLGPFTISVTGWLASRALYFQTVTVGPQLSGLALANFGFLGVDQVTFEVQSNSQWFLADNLTYSEVSVTPEPATLLLLGTGLMGMVGAGLLRRKKNAALSD